MPILQQLLAHAVIFTMAFGGVACLCPVDAAGTAAGMARADHAEHGDPGAHAGDAATDAGCGHEQCGPDCAGIVAASAKSKPLKSAAPGKVALDDLERLPVVVAAWPESARQPARAAHPFPAGVRAQDSPVRRFDRLLD